MKSEITNEDVQAQLESLKNDLKLYNNTRSKIVSALKTLAHQLERGHEGMRIMAFGISDLRDKLGHYQHDNESLLGEEFISELVSTEPSSDLDFDWRNPEQDW